MRVDWGECVWVSWNSHVVFFEQVGFGVERGVVRIVFFLFFGFLIFWFFNFLVLFFCLKKKDFYLTVRLFDR